MVPQPVFVLASARSFTTIVSGLLGQHPQVYGAPELNLLMTPTLGQLVRGTKVVEFQLHGLIRTIAQLYTGEQTMASVDTARRWIQKRYTWTSEAVYHELAAKVAPLRIIDKSPKYATSLQVLKRTRQAFPNAHYLYLVRHPRTQGLSMMKLAHGALAGINRSLDYSTDPPTVDPQLLWYKTQRTVLDFLSTVPAHQQMRVRGEDILNQPEDSLSKVCEWLGLQWDSSVFEAMLRPEDSVYARFGPYGAHLGNDPNFLRSPAFRYQQIPAAKLAGPLPWRKDGMGFLVEIMELARELGYE
ncbi:sulfotransferase [Candidatus Cyanaurora vandensis]|uniref:sulfotransferase family protein n=1 Tax=Candidatus Cyanaurora vandensis TaxID=2714958 RepID=UPI00257A03F7|nr:sulfotransferase [Candidatus Cyanaurora vandensis]